MIKSNQYQKTYKDLVDIKYALDISSIVFITDRHGYLTYVNDNFCKVMNYSRDVLLNKNIFSFFSKKMSETYVSNLQKVTSKGIDWHGELHLIDNDRQPCYLNTSVIPIINENGTPTQNISIAQNITKEKLVQKELKRNNKLFVKGPVVVLTWNAQKNWPVQYVSENIRQFGYEPEEFIDGGKNYYSIVHEEDHARIHNEVYMFIESGIDCFDQEYRIVKKNGEIIWVYDFTRIVRDTNGKINFLDGYILDISDRKNSEKLLQNSDKLSLVGELAAGVAHEIRNPLTSIKGFTQILKSDLPPEREMYVDIILDEINRIQSILTEFMNLAKPQVQNLRESDIIPLLSDVISLMNTDAILKGVQIKTNFSDESSLIRCDENQVKQVFVNFIKNAIEAMTNGGTLTISTNQLENFVLIKFVDNGTGIPESILQKLGKPFFTTKEEGNGLGLMVSYKIIEQHQGHIEVESKLNEGTTFSIYLPILT